MDSTSTSPFHPLYFNIDLGHHNRKELFLPQAPRDLNTILNEGVKGGSFLQGGRIVSSNCL